MTNSEGSDAIQGAISSLGCVHQGIVITDRVGIIIETNLATDRILEAGSLSLKGSDIRKLCAAPRNYEEMIFLVFKNGQAQNRPLVVQTGGGKRRLVSMSIERVGAGDDLRLVHVVKDCADLRTVEESLLQSAQLATIGKFASQIAHEIRNPLSSISLNMELLEDEIPSENQEARDLIGSVLHELDRVNDVVAEYLQFSRFPEPRLVRGSVDGVIQDFAALFKPPPGVKLELALMPHSPEVWLDERLLHQALENLVRNAADAIDGSGTITIETDALEQFLVIHVKDSGPGIAEEIQSRLFEPFFTTKPHGTGLGLATTKQIVFELNGHLLVESEPGNGATFTMLLPR